VLDREEEIIGMRARSVRWIDIWLPDAARSAIIVYCGWQPKALVRRTVAVDCNQKAIREHTHDANTPTESIM
jgi:hypothetical protein